MYATSAPRAGVREWLGLAVLTLPTVLLGLDVTVLYLALPALSADLRPTATEELWIMDTYGFLIAGFLITMGTIGDRIGRRRLLLIGATSFGTVSVVAAYSTSPEMLIVARGALGIAGATLMPSTLALVSTMFPDARQRALAIGVWATAFAVGMAAGPLVGGILLDHFWWGSAFLLAVPLIGLVLCAAPAVLPEYRAPDHGRIDPSSVALSSAAMLALVYAVKHGASAGFDRGTVLALLLGGAAAVWFVRRQHSLADPLFDLGLFRLRSFTAALTVLLVGLMAVGGVMFPVTQYLQLVAGLSPRSAGAWMGPPALLMLIAAVAAPLLARRVRPGYVVGGTLLVSSLGYLVLALAPAENGLFPVVAGFALVYLGLGTIAALGTDLVVGAAPPERAGSASAMSETVQELGIAVGVAVLGSLIGAVYRDRLGTDGGRNGDLPAEAADGLPGAATVADRLPPGAWAAAREAFTSGMNTAAAVAGIAVVALAVISVAALRHVGTTGGEDTSGEDIGDGDHRGGSGAPSTIAYPGGSQPPGQNRADAMRGERRTPNGIAYAAIGRRELSRRASNARGASPYAADRSDPAGRPT